jgi:hypothetical protein
MLELVKVAAPLLAIVSSVLILFGSTKLGKMKVFRFTLGVIALVTAIAWAFQTALAVSAFTLSGTVIWFAISLVNFAQATWLATD